MLIDEDDVIGIVVYNDEYTIVSAPKWDWVLDGEKWNAAWLALGQPIGTFSSRGGMTVLDRKNADLFLQSCNKFTLSELKNALLHKKGQASWWDVRNVFPQLILNFDSQTLIVAYEYESNPMWINYIHNGWSAEIIDFITDPDAIALPVDQRYWYYEGENMINAFAPE